MRALVVEDQALVREGFKLLIDSLPAVTACDVAGTLSEACATLRNRDDIGLVLLDLGLPDAVGQSAVVQLHAVAGDARIVVCSGEESAGMIRQCLAAGAHGYVTKNASPSAFQSAIELVLRGERYVPPEILGGPLDAGAGVEPQQGEGLTPRQREVLARLAAGLTNKEIAAELAMSPATVRAHVSAILRALGVDNRTQAAGHPEARALLARARHH